MALRIRLRRVGRKKQPSYRIVVADSEAARDGKYLDILGFYNPRRRPGELRLDLARLDEWLSQGASPSATVRSLVRKARKGGDDSIALYTGQPEPEADSAEAEEATDAAPTGAPADPAGASAAAAEPVPADEAATPGEAVPAEEPTTAAAETTEDNGPPATAG